MDGSRLSPVARDRSRHAAPQIVEVLREEILGLVLSPGTALARALTAAGVPVQQQADTTPPALHPAVGALLTVLDCVADSCLP